MCQRVGRTDRITDRMIDRMTDTSSCITAVFFSSYKLPKTVTVTMLWLLFYSYFGPVTLLCGTFLGFVEWRISLVITLCTPSDQQMESALTIFVCSCSVISPVQFVVHVNSQLLVRCHHFNVHSLDIHLCAGLSVPVEIHHLLNASKTKEPKSCWWISAGTVHKVLKEFSIGSVVTEVCRWHRGF